LPRREIIRRLGTSASQFYRLLDQTNYKKSVDQVLALLNVLGCEVHCSVNRDKVQRRSITKQQSSSIPATHSAKQKKELIIENGKGEMTTDHHEINWNNFKAKFNGKEEKSFEYLCYLMFCSEFGQDKGIFRYKNQTGIETEPIEKDGAVIGWQAKFLETKISMKKKELKQSIEATKRKNPSITTILFYLNQEFSESRGKNKKEPAYKIEIEDYAKSKGVKVEWRVPSHLRGSSH